MDILIWCDKRVTLGCPSGLRGQTQVRICFTEKTGEISGSH